MRSAGLSPVTSRGIVAVRAGVVEVGEGVRNGGNLSGVSGAEVASGANVIGI